jgi:homoserine dehydrogenase
VVAEGNFVGRLLFMGRGAGEGPTASAVAADLIDIARGENGPAFAMPAMALSQIPHAGPEARSGRAYVRLTVQDRPGVLADITAALRDAGVSIESLIQPASAPDGTALIVMLTHESHEQAVAHALDAMAALPASTAAPLFMPILPEDG